MAYSTVHTLAGLEALTSAEVTGQAINLTHMAVGDGNGNEVEPSEGQGSLVREVFRAPVNRVYQNAGNPQRFTAELVVPATVGGFTMREVGVFDADGTLITVGNLPPTYKPQDSEGAYADTVVRVEFQASNADVVTLQVDPAVAVATQQWITNNVTARIVLPGGSTGQIPVKRSNADGDIEWRDPSATSANVRVDTLEEYQTLEAGQVNVTLAVCTTYGLALYVNGARLRTNEWTADPEDDTKLTLAASYAAGTRLICVQNEPAGGQAAPLIRGENLADVPNKATARTNLQVPSLAQFAALVPPGAIVHFARSSSPGGYLVCNGAAVNREVYASLFAAIGTTWGNGDGFNTFNLPDFRGEFLRGWDDQRGVDAGRQFASFQDQGLGSHFHYLSATGKQSYDLTAANYVVEETSRGGDTEYHLRGANNAPTIGRSSAVGGAETRPRNRAVLICIKY